MLAALLSGVVVPIIAAVDSFRIARHTRHDYQLKEYNRWYVYVLLLTLISGGGVGYSLHIRARYAQAFVIPSSSMYPTIMHGDRVLASKIAYASADPARGDIIVFPNPNNRRQRYVKRVVALEGDTVEITGGVLIINGQPLARRTLAPMSSAPKTPDRSGTVFEEINGAAVYKVYVATDREGLKTKTDLPLTTVPKYHCFVLGDNRDSSCDSRAFGAVRVAGAKSGRIGLQLVGGEPFAQAEFSVREVLVQRRVVGEVVDPE